ncbi:MAG: DUF2812 domain-containing protein [Bacillota bacterium]|nr:DUF2812 domain-containing protein [Bacillota bacterium]
MRQTIYKVFMAWDYEKEEEWLNEMSAKGLQLVSVSLIRYEFEEAEAGEYIYRIELLDHLPAHPESRAYIRFLEDTGAEHIGSYFRWVYICKKRADGAFDLYSDRQSRIKHYGRILLLLYSISALFVITFTVNFIDYVSSGNTTNLVFMIIHFIVGLLMVRGIFSLLKKIRKLKKETTITE